MGWFWGRVGAVWCRVRGHRVIWRTAADAVCRGDILCDTCRVVWWCRALDPRWLR